jgi:hypothetical protein
MLLQMSRTVRRRPLAPSTGRLPAGLLVVALMLGTPASVGAQGASDTQVWVMGLATVPVRDDWRLHLELQPRASVEDGMTTEVLTRVALGRRVAARATLWAGYAWIARPPGPGVTHEHRAWQQLSLGFPAVARWTPSLRVRVEQRAQAGWEGLSHRVRAMSRLARPITDSRRWSAVAWHEGFVTLDRTARGPARGLDQHRVFGGVLRQLTPVIGVEAGYLWRTSRRPDSTRTHVHSAFLWLNVTP